MCSIFALATVFSLALGLANSKQVFISLRENFTHTCPNVRSDLIDKNSLKISFDMISSGAGGDMLTVTSQNGESRTISFPGCYNVRLSFRMKQPLKNPYVEAFLQLGTNIPCQSEGTRGISNICTNITQTNWCPQSTNEKLRRLLDGKKTCRFCNICDSLKSKQDEIENYIRTTGVEECRTDKEFQTISFKMCTPSKKELREQNKEHEDKLEEYWSYLKQGVLTAVVHVTDRAQPDPTKMTQCRRLCSTYSAQRGVSSAYKSTLLRSIENLCTPQDSYAACIYHTMKFDVQEDFS